MRLYLAENKVVLGASLLGILQIARCGPACPATWHDAPPERQDEDFCAFVIIEDYSGIDVPVSQYFLVRGADDVVPFYSLLALCKPPPVLPENWPRVQSEHSSTSVKGCVAGNRSS